MPVKGIAPVSRADHRTNPQERPIGAAELLRSYLESPAGSDLLGEMVKMGAELLLDADVDHAMAYADLRHRCQKAGHALGDKIHDGDR